MPETPTPSLAERQAAECLVNGDIGAAQLEIVRRLKMMLPESIAAENLLRGWTTPALEIPRPKSFGVAPSLVTGDDIGRVLVSADLSTMNSSPGVMTNRVTIVVFSIDTRAKVEQQILTHWRRGELIRRDLFSFLNGCCNEHGKKVWNQLIPVPGLSLLPSTFSPEWSGVAARFTLTMTEGP